MTNRRDFLGAMAVVGLGMGSGGSPARIGYRSQLARQEGITRAEHPLRILILGGTAFLGPAEVEYAMARGHTLTLFNRGRTNPHLFPEMEKIVGDSATPDYSALQGREWDAAGRAKGGGVADHA